MKEDGEEQHEQIITQSAGEQAHAASKNGRVAIISDIHSNLQALEAVLADCHTRGVESFCCLGDIVGYAAHPAECLERVRALGGPVVIGNHDYYVAQGRVDDDISGVAMAGVQFSQSKLGKAQKKWLAANPQVHREEGFTLVHASLDRPLKWDYIFDSDDAGATMRLQETAVCFFGHTHLPSLFVGKRGSGANYQVEAEGVFKFRREGWYLINPGSVGQPRGSGDPRAQYAILDEDACSVEFVRVEYDTCAAAKAIIEAGLPTYLADRLMEGV